METKLKASAISNLKYLSDQIYKLHLDEEFEGHNYETLTDIDYIIACQIIEANEHTYGLSKEDIETVKEANMEVRRQNCNRLPFADKVLPIPNDIVELGEGVKDIAREYIIKSANITEANETEPIKVKVIDVDYASKTVTLKGGAVVNIDNVTIVEPSDF